MGINRKVYLSVNNQALTADIELLKNQLNSRGFEVVEHVSNNAWNPDLIKECQFTIVLPSPYLYEKARNLWIIGKGQYTEINTAWESGMDVYCKDIKNGELYPIVDVFKIAPKAGKSEDWIKYATVDTDMDYSVDYNSLLGDYFDRDAIITDESGQMCLKELKYGSPIQNQAIPKEFFEYPQQDAYSTTIKPTGSFFKNRSKRKRLL